MGKPVIYHVTLSEEPLNLDAWVGKLGPRFIHPQNGFFHHQPFHHSKEFIPKTRLLRHDKMIFLGGEDHFRRRQQKETYPLMS